MALQFGSGRGMLRRYFATFTVIPLIDSLQANLKGEVTVNRFVSPHQDQEVDRRRASPIIFCDSIPEASYNATQRILDLSLATTLPQNPKLARSPRPLVIVADLKMPLETAKKLRDMLDKIILSASADGSAH